MIRTCFLPAAAVALLAGCVSTYGYRQGQGDYYYGRPSVEYREYYDGAWWPYGYPHWRFNLHYGYPVRYCRGPYAPYYRCRYYGYPHFHDFYGYPYRYRERPRRVDAPTHDPAPDSKRPPWRDLDRLRRTDRPGAVGSLPPEPTRATAPRLHDHGDGNEHGFGRRSREIRERDQVREQEP